MDVKELLFYSMVTIGASSSVFLMISLLAVITDYEKTVGLETLKALRLNC
jgi:hypothetical protein